MSGNTVIRVEGVSKKFSRSLKHVMAYGAEDIARNLIGLQASSERLREGEFWAVNNVSFELSRGETIGLIGINGSGKSTILKMLNGIFMPDKGKIEIKGRVGALIEVGAGFHPMLTGRENIYVNGVIHGMTKKDIDKRYDEIVKFADIGEFINLPMKHYSSGMTVRLGFSIIAHCEPDILLIDEVLAVGDMDFQYKCIKKIEEFRSDGKALVLISHDIIAVKKLCSRVILLSHGATEYDHTVGETIDRYFFDIAEHMVGTTHGKAIDDGNVGKKTPKKIFFTNVRLCDAVGKQTDVFIVGQPIVIKTSVISMTKIAIPSFGAIVYSEDGIYLGGFNSLAQEVFLNSVEEGHYEIEYRIDGIFLQGRYFLTLVIHDGTGKIIYDMRDRSDYFVVGGDIKSLPYSGYVKIPCIWNYKKILALEEGEKHDYSD
ncbi:MAG: ABC transporter ATP-binding protein [Desulfamplus sp.]|nr:ABC transporter ATP-binding protein [Desulfamplus sp.]